MAPLCKTATADCISWDVPVMCKDIDGFSADQVCRMVFQGLKTFANTIVREGRWGTTNAVVTRDDTVFGFYLTTNKDGSSNNNRQRDIKAHIEKFGLSPSQRLGSLITITKVLHFTKVTQRRLGWATAEVQRKDVEAAVEKDDHDELLALMPAARGCIDSGNLDLVPQLFNHLQSGQLALTDCVHELVYEGTSRFLNGPCNKCSISKTEQRKCCKCNLTWCLRCVPSIVEEKEERQRAQEAYHDVTEHMWEDATDVFCGKCERSHETGVTCFCGAARCRPCSHVHNWTWVNGRTCDYCSSEPALKACECNASLCRHCCVARGIDTKELYVCPEGDVIIHMLDYTKYNDDLKLELITMEIGGEADLQSFSKAYLKFFGDLVTKHNQKQYCLLLYRRYAKISEVDDKGAYEDLETARSSAYTKESRIPPSELQNFQRLWDKNAPSRCLHCNAAVPDGRTYCKQHQAAGFKLSCKRRIAGGLVCGGTIKIINDCHVCNECDWGKKAAEDTWQPTGHLLDETMIRFQKDDRMISKCYTKRERDPDAKVEWHKRKRL